MWVILFVIGYVPQMSLPNLKYAKCDYACLADRAYALCQKSKTADDKQKQKIYKELSDIQQVMSEQAEYTQQDTIQVVHKKYTDDDLFPADMFK